MSGLLIHSMSEFAEIIVNSLEISGASRVAEIGAEFGGMSRTLADYTRIANGHLYSVDPEPKSEFENWVTEQEHVTHIKKPSLDAFGQLHDIDAWVIDGDHNWYTVYHELQAIDEICQREEKPFMAILHDVCWPCGRRDAYYNPDAIPMEYRHAYCTESGVKTGHQELMLDRGFRGMGQFGWALHEGGERNGVKCAVEDFIAESEAVGRQLAYAEVPAVFGLGILFSADAPWADRLSEYLLPFHGNPLIARLEQNRIANYLTVLDWQDGFMTSQQN